MENTEQTNNIRVQLQAKVEPSILAAVERLAQEDDRSLSNMVERLLKQSPQVKEILDSEPVAA